MTLSLKNLLLRFEKILPPQMQEKWDNAGLNFGKKSQKISGILFSYDVCLEVIREARLKKCEMIVSHHPFRMPFSDKNDTYLKRIIKECVKNGIALYSCHTQHDNAPFSLNTVILKKMSITKTHPLLPLSRKKNWGSGRFGDLPKKSSLQKLLPQIKKIFGVQKLRVVANTQSHQSASTKKIRRIGIVTGSGASMIPLALQHKCDLLITGDIKYHQAIDALRQDLILIDPGHFFSEIESISELKTLFSQIFPNELKFCTYDKLQDAFKIR